MILDSNVNQPVIILLIILGVAAIIAIIAFIIYRILHLKLKDEEKKDDKEIAKEELDRILQPIDDEELSKEISEYSQDDEDDKK
jgi:flagellar biosynthesis/type III secretory pathway M-ring protein FliF/YscJ